tara:strand:+ start:5854 stop:6429 length:576 start_codon:yes stop_codon:yes gene_type:complete
MSLVQTSAPSVEPVTTTNQKDWMRVDGSDEDTLIGNLAAASRAYVEMSTNRQMITATWVYKFDTFPSGDIVLPISPLQSVTSITYVDTAGATQTWSNSLYTVDTASDVGRVRPIYDEDYPSSRGYAQDIVVTFVAGYGDASSDVPDTALTAIKLLASNWFENRESNAPVELKEVPMALQTLIWSLKDGSSV